MGSSLALLCRRPVLSFDSELYSKRLGHNCEVCNASLTHEKCLSLCKCYLFCHQHCFISQFEPSLVDEDIDIICKYCSDKVAVKMETNFVYQPNWTALKVIKLVVSLLILILCLIAIVVTLRTPLRTEVSFVLLYLEGLSLGIGVYFSVITMKEVLYRKLVSIKEILSTRLEIQTSAFKDLDIETND